MRGEHTNIFIRIMQGKAFPAHGQYVKLLTFVADLEQRICLKF